MFIKQPPTTHNVSKITIRLVILLLLAGLGLWFGGRALAKSPGSTNAVTTTCTVNAAGGGSYTTIQDAVNDANCDLIDVAAGTYVENVVITRDVSIRGAGVLSTTVDGGGAGRVFLIDNANATVGLARMTIRNGGFPDGLVGDGGGIHNKGRLTAYNLLITDNAVNSGGGIYNSGTLTMTNSTISANSAANGGGGLYDDGFITILDSVIQENDASWGGGIVVTDHTVVDNTDILTNTTGGGYASPGGGIYVMGVLTLTNSTVSGNDSGNYGDGGGIGVSRVTCGRLVVVNTSITKNTGDNGAGISYNSGEAWNCNETIEISDSDISGNDGNGVSGYGNLTIENSRISNNLHNGVTAVNALLLTHSLVHNNVSFGVATGNSTIEYSTIHDNTNGGVYCDAGTLTMRYSTVSGNSSNGNGGGILGTHLVGSDCILDIESSTIYNNHSDLDGGGIYSSGYITLTNSTISGNSANGDGGGLYFGDDGDLNSATITDNTADQDGNGTGDGGGIFLGGVAGTGRMTSSILAVNNDNTPAGPVHPDCSGNFYGGGYDVIGIYDNNTCTGFGSATNQNGSFASPLDPLLSPLADNGGPTLTHAPDPTSPAVDWLDPNPNCPTNDQRGASRPKDGDGDSTATCDIGAFELGTCLTPRVPTLSINRAGNDALLSWSENSINREYVSYRTTDYIQLPDVISTTLHGGSYTDYGAIGDPNANYTYMVRGENSCGVRSPFSNVVGEFDFALTFGAGGRALKFALISLPLEGSNLPTTADGVAVYIDPNGSVKGVARWRPLTRSFIVRRVGSPFGTPDFPVSPGDVLFIGVDSTAPASFAWVGDVPAAGSITNTLHTNTGNFITVPLDQSDVFTMDADGLAADIGGVTHVARWNRLTQSWILRTVGVSGPNFLVHLGYPYAVITDNTAPPFWP